MPEHVEIEGKRYAVTGHTEKGVPIIKGHATTVHHKDEHGNLMYDKDGNPVQSVHVSVSPIEPITEKEQ